MNLHSRCIHILLFVLSQDKPVKVNQIMENYKVSERTIRYDLDEIEHWLNKQNLGKLDVIYAEGITVTCTPENKTSIFELFEGKLSNDYFYSSDERQKIILLELLNTDQPITMDLLQKKLSISRGTVIKELKSVDEWLSKYKLTLARKPNYGMEIKGEESYKRSALIGIANDFMTTEQILGMIKLQDNRPVRYDYPYKKYGIRQDKMLFDIDLGLLEESLNILENLLGAQLGDNAFASLFTHLAIALQRVKAGKGIFIPVEELILLENTPEFKIAENFSSLLEKKFNTTIPKSEIGYITLHILGSQFQKPSVTSSNNISNTVDDEISNHNLATKNHLSKDHEIDYFQMAKDITYFVKKLLNIEFMDDHKLMIDLAIHLKPAIYRCRYNMSLTNPLLEDIKRYYHRIFLVVKEALLLLKVKYTLEISEHEISYIVLHFAAEIEKEKVMYCKRLNILLVCASGIGTSKMLYNRLNANFKDLNIVNTVSYLDYFKKEDWNVDLVISTINIKSSSHPCLIVNPLLIEEDIIRIEEYLLINAIKNNKDTNKPSLARTNMPQEWMPNDQTSGLLLQSKKKQDNKVPSVISPEPQASIQNVLTSNTIKLDILVNNWEEAIRMGADILLKQGLIEPQYISALIATVRNFGPYIVIAPGIALSHAKPENGVLSLGLSFIRLKTPVTFGHKENDPVSLVFTLAPTDNFSHHKLLTQLMKIFLNKKDLDVLFQSSDLKDILECVSHV